jgi:hypothetical protein
MSEDPKDLVYIMDALMDLIKRVHKIEDAIRPVPASDAQWKILNAETGQHEFITIGQALNFLACNLSAITYPAHSKDTPLH